jgi:hypothetical protein
MTLRLTEIVVDCRDPQALAAFWTAALGYHITRIDHDQAEIGPWEQEPTDLADQVRHGPTAPTIVFVIVEEGKAVKNRLHLDVRPVDRSPEEEVERLIGLGASRVDIGQGSVPWTVLADPEGNEFCLLGPLP